MSKIRIFIALILLLVISEYSQGSSIETVELDLPSDYAILRGFIDMPAVKGITSKLEKLAKQNRNSSIFLVIDSFGGEVEAGFSLIDAVNQLKSKYTVKVKCLADQRAASMAFQLYLHCDERFAFNYTYLMWHPMRLNFQAAPNIYEIIAAVKSAEPIVNRMVRELLAKLDIDPAIVEEHYFNETYHFGRDLNKLSPGFFTIVKSVNGYEDMRLRPADRIKIQKSKSKQVNFQYPQREGESNE